jgi:hypothetical protein
MAFDLSRHSLIPLLVTVFLIASSFSPVPRNKQETKELLTGTWVHKQGNDKTSLRYIKANKIPPNTEAMVFDEDGSVILHTPLGCQTPLPNIRPFRADWYVKNKNTVIIDRHFPGEDADKMKLIKLNKQVLRFVWE